MRRKSPLPAIQCSVRLMPEGGIGFRNKFCTRPGKTKQDGKWYCLHHDPEKKKLRQALAAENQRARTERAKKMVEMARLAQKLLEALEFITDNGLLQGPTILHAKASSMAFTAIADAYTENQEGKPT
jgi:hypothetical protein